MKSFQNTEDYQPLLPVPEIKTFKYKSFALKGENKRNLINVMTPLMEDNHWRQGL